MLLLVEGYLDELLFTFLVKKAFQHDPQAET